MLKSWIKSVLWTAIIVNIIAAGRITRIYLEVTKEIGQFGAGIVTLCILILFGIIFGSIYFGFNLLILGKDKVIQKKPTNEYCIGLTVSIVLLAYLGNLITLIVVGCYLIIRKIIKKFKNKTAASTIFQ